MWQFGIFHILNRDNHRFDRAAAFRQEMCQPGASRSFFCQPVTIGNRIQDHSKSRLSKKQGRLPEPADGQDQIMGRVLAMMPFGWPDWMMLPPHFPANIEVPRANAVQIIGSIHLNLLNNVNIKSLQWWGKELAARNSRLQRLARVDDLKPVANAHRELRRSCRMHPSPSKLPSSSA